VTTAGFSAGPLDEAPAVVGLILAGMVVGGGIGSTAGGIKVDRALAFARMVGLALTRLRAPQRAVTRLTAGGRKLEADRVVGMVAVAFLYAATLLMAWIAFLVGGAPPLPALFEVVSALSTAGLSSGVTGPDLAWPLKVVLIAAMLLGRLEFLALIAVLSPATWAPRA
jgi:trk system potassium uptake protein TrkH